MEVLGVFGVVGGTFCVASVLDAEDHANMDENAPSEFIGLYEENPHGWWEGHGLEYFMVTEGDEIIEEYAGLSLQKCIELYFDHSLEDIRDLIKTRLYNAGLDIDYQDIKWKTMITIQGD